MASNLNSEFNYRYQVIGSTPWEKIKTLQGFYVGRKRAAVLEECAELKYQAKLEELKGLPIDGIADAQVLAELGIDTTSFSLGMKSRNTSVAAAQTALSRVLNIKIKADGIFGSGTARQLKRFQKTVGLKQTGVIDRTTWLSLLAASAAVVKTK